MYIRKKQQQTGNQGLFEQQSKEPVTDPSKIATWEPSNQEFKIAILREFGDHQDNIEKQFRNWLEKFNKEIEIVQEIKSWNSEIHLWTEKVIRGSQQQKDHTKERISELERLFEDTQLKKKKDQRCQA